MWWAIAYQYAKAIPISRIGIGIAYDGRLSTRAMLVHGVSLEENQ